MICGGDLVEAYFGYWPDFADGRVERFMFTLPASVFMTVYYIDSDLNKAARVELAFSGVKEIGLSEIASDNVIDRLALHLTSGIATIEATYLMFNPALKPTYLTSLRAAKRAA
jgi:hypothetical protein